MNEKSKELSERILNLKKKIDRNNDFFVFEPNKLDLLIDDFFNIISSNYKKKINQIFVKNLIINSITFFRNSIKYFFHSFKNIFNSIQKLEEKFEKQQKILLKTIELNNELLQKINKIDEKFNSTIIKIKESNKLEYSLEQKEQFRKSNITNSSELSKLNFIQEENLRISKELYESKNKVEIMKKELEKFNKQRTDLINKINSVNEIVNDSNVLTSVFDNDLKDKKIIVIDPDKANVNHSNEKDLSLNEKIKQIFIKK